MAEGRNVKNENWDEEIFSRRLEFSLLLFMEFFYYCFPFPSPKKEMEFSVIEDLDFSMIEIIRDRGSRLIFSRRKNFEIRHRNFPRDVRQSRGVIWFLPNCSKILKIKNFSRDRAASLHQQSFKNYLPYSQILSVLFSRVSKLLGSKNCKMEDLADAISIRIYSRKLEDTNLRYVSSRLLFHANLISNLQRRYLREIISKVCFFRGIYFPSPLSLFVKFIAAGEFFLLLLLPFLPLLLLLPLLWSLNAARLNIPYFHFFVCWKCAFLALPRAFERGSDYYSIDVYDFCKEGKGGGGIYLRS